MKLIRRWSWPARHLVLGAELLLAASFLFFGHQLLAGQPSPAIPTLTRHVPAASPEVGSGSVAIPRGPGPVVTPTPVLATILGLGTDPGVVDRINRDDLLLYRRQWQVLGLLVTGIRQYLEYRVVPTLLAR